MKKRVLFYLVDGAHSEVLPELLAAGELPNIGRVATEGTRTTATTCFPSVTGPAYLPFLNGFFPGTLNVPGIRWFDKKEFKRSRFNKQAMRSYCGPEAFWFNTDSDVSKPTLFELLPDAYNLNGMVNRGIKEENDLMRKGKGSLYINAHFRKKHHEVDAETQVRLMNMLRSGNDFDFIYCVFPSVDWDSHMYDVRDPRTIKAYRMVDRSLGEVRSLLEEKGWWDDTLFILTSDHGLTGTHSHFDVGDWLTAEGLKAVYYPAIWKLNPKSSVQISGNSFASIHLLNHEGDHVLTESGILRCMGDRFDKLLRQAAVDLLIYRGDDVASFIVNSDRGKARISKSGETYRYEMLTGDPLTIGGNLSVEGHRAALDATFHTDYPDSLVQIAQLFGSRRAGDIVISARVGHDLRDFWEFPEHKGSHGSLHRLHMHVPMIMNKPIGVDFPARTVDLYNTILEWTGRGAQPSEGESLLAPVATELSTR